MYDNGNRQVSPNLGLFMRFFHGTDRLLIPLLSDSYGRSKILIAGLKGGTGLQLSGIGFLIRFGERKMGLARDARPSRNLFVFYSLFVVGQCGRKVFTGKDWQDNCPRYSDKSLGV